MDNDKLCEAAIISITVATKNNTPKNKKKELSQEKELSASEQLSKTINKDQEKT